MRSVRAADSALFETQSADDAMKVFVEFLGGCVAVFWFSFQAPHHNPDNVRAQIVTVLRRRGNLSVLHPLEQRVARPT